MSAATCVFGIPLLADKILLDVSIRDLVCRRRVSHVLLESVIISAPLQRAMFM